MVILTEQPLDPGRVYELLPFPDGSGSVLVHFGVVKAAVDDRRTRGIRFQRAGDSEAEMREIEKSLRSRWKLLDVLLMRRLGSLAVGEVVSLVAVAASGREDALGACGEAISAFKKMKTLDKQELFVDGGP
jgi:molybdopterin synthase catalytic subunit